MSSDTPRPQVAPGRVGTLTENEEERLKELWLALLKVFGQGQEANGLDDAAEAASETSSTSGSKKKASKFGWRKKKDEGDGAGKSSNDKYSQTADFKAALANQSPKELRSAFWGMVKADDPDGLLLRFLRARKWDVGNALVMLVGTMEWRDKQMDVDEIVRNGEEAALQNKNEEFLKQLRMGKAVLHGEDREGRPINVVTARLHHASEQSEKTMERFTVYTIESVRMLLRDPVDTALLLFDLTDFSLSNMEYAPVKFMIKCFEAHYPESLGICLVHRAPWVFQGIWNIIKGWLDPVVASKFHFTNSVEDLEKFISRDHILARFGGDEKWAYEYPEPVPGENEKMKDDETRDRIWKERLDIVNHYEELTKQWIDKRNVEKQRKEQGAKLRKNYWLLDPYVRARTYLDRIGVLGADGRVQMYESNE